MLKLIVTQGTRGMTFQIDQRETIMIPLREKVKDRDLINKVAVVKRRAHQNNYSESIHRKSTGNLCYNGGKVIRAEMPGQDRKSENKGK